MPGFYVTPMCWRVKQQGVIPGYGKPTNENLHAKVLGFEQSCEPGGPNAHLGTRKVASAKIVHQFTGEVVAIYKRAD
jgi:hypothetical protein